MIFQAGILGLVGGGTWFFWSRALSLLFLPAQVVYAIRQPVLEQKRTDFLKIHTEAERVKIPVGSYSLDGVEIKHPHSSLYANNNSEVKYFLHLNANGVCYEEKLDSMVHLREVLQQNGWLCNMLVINYRGVGHSTGRALSAADLVEDSIAAIKWLQQVRGVKINDILVHGHSIGGAAGVLACSSVEKLLNSSNNNGDNNNTSNNDTPSPPLAKEGGDPSTLDHEMIKKKPNSSPFIFADRTFYSLKQVVDQKLGTAFDMGPIGGILFANLALFGCTIANLILKTEIPRSQVVSIAGKIVSTGLISYGLDAILGKQFPLTQKIKGLTSSERFKIFAIYLTRTTKLVFIFLLMHISSEFFGPCWDISLLFTALGYLLGKKGYLNKIALKLVDFIGWKMDLETEWKDFPIDRKLASFHAMDGMIPPSVSLCQIVNSDINITTTNNNNNNKTGNQIQQSNHIISLQGAYGDAHMYDIFSRPMERDHIINKFKPFFGN